MPTFSSNGVEIYYQVAGEGYPLVMAHEFAGDITSWEPQVNYFSRRYRVITYCHRGYPPSEVPNDPEAYSQDLQVEDLYRLLQYLGIEQAHIGWPFYGWHPHRWLCNRPSGDVPVTGYSFGRCWF